MMNARCQLLAVLLVICSSVYSQDTLTASSIEPGGEFILKNEPFSYGNDVVRRLVFLPSQAKKSWVDLETSLPNGRIFQFIIFVHDDTRATGSISIPLRIQIWRPSTDSSDIINVPLTLVWEARVEVKTNYADGALYRFSLTSSGGVSVQEGDRIGWTYEDSVGPISFEYSEGVSNAHKTYFRNVVADSYPLVGENYVFNSYLPSAFSVAVSLVPVNVDGSIFECTFDEGFCTFTQESSTVFNRLTTSTPSADTGPNSGQGNTGFYAYLEASDPAVPGDAAVLATPTLNYLGDVCVSFWYHMKGSHIGTVNVYSRVDGVSTRIFTISGAQGDDWINREVDILMTVNTKIIFEATRGSGYQGDIGLDTIDIYAGKCTNPVPETPSPATTPTTTTTESTSASTTESTTPTTTTESTTASTTPTTTTTTTTTPAPAPTPAPTPEAPILLFACDFISSTSCPDIGQAQFGANWSWINDRTPSDNTGPDAGQKNDGYYFMETSDPIIPGAYGRFFIRKFFGPLLVCVDFWYHMYGEHMGSLFLYIEDQNLGSRQYNFSSSGDLGNRWLHAEIDILLTSPTQVIGWEGIKGVDFRSDLAVDSIQIYTGSCNQDATPVRPTTVIPTTTPVSTSTASTSTQELPTTTVATTTTSSSGTDPIIEITRLRAKPSFLFARQDTVAHAWCMVLHNLPPGEDLKITWFLPDGSEIPSPEAFYGPNDERFITKYYHEETTGYYSSSLYVGVSDPSYSGTYTCKAQYGSKVLTDALHIVMEGCPPNYYQCENKDCIERNWVCDGIDDCNDWSDENDCL